MDAPTIPGYDILAPLPQGGMSAVFKARQISLDRVVVLKILPPAMAADVVDIEKFLAEAKITAQLKHPNIVQVYDFGKSPDGIYYFVMEFISGYSVADWIRRKTRLALKDTLLCAHCVADALDYAWKNYGVVHCDIKPDNVIIDGDGTVKVADLGLARSVRSVMDKAKFNMGIVVGTPYYISPEQSQGRLELDYHTDIYSLGAMLYHCLSGKLPFEGLPLMEIMDCQITDQIPDLIDLQPNASMTVACLIEKMMAKNIDYRQKDWPEVIRDMIRARTDLLPEGPLPPAGASTMKRCPAREQYLKNLGTSAHPIPAPKPSEAATAAPSSAGQALPESFPKRDQATPARLRQSASPRQEHFAQAIAASPVAKASVFAKASPDTSPDTSARPVAQASRPSEPIVHIISRPRRQMKSELLAAVIMILAIAVPSLLVVNMLIKPEHAVPPQDGRQTTDDRRRTTDDGGQTTEDGRQTTDDGGQPARRSPALPDEGGTTEGGVPAEALAQRRLEAALQWYRTNPDQFNEAIHQFAKIATESKGMRCAQIAQDEIVRIRERKRVAMAADMKALRDKVQPLLARQKFAEAAALYEHYEGPFKTETMAERSAKVQECLDQDRIRHAETLQAAEEQRWQWQGILNDVVTYLVEGNPAAALAVVQQTTNNTVLSANRNDSRTLASMLGEAVRADRRLLDSFRSQKDQEVVVALNKGPEHLVVRDVQGDTILVERKIVVSTGQLAQSKVIRLQDLSLAEKKARLGTSTTPDTALVHGLMALRDGDWAAAETSWSQAGPILSAPLIAKLRERKSRQREDQARSDFILLLRAAQVETVDVSGAKGGPLPGCEAYLAAIYRKKYLSQTAKVLANSVAAYQEQYALTAFAQAYAPALAALKHASVITSDSNETARTETAPALAKTGSPDGAAVRKELFVRNPSLTEFNVSLVTNDAGEIARAELISADLKDIKPLAGLPNLRAVVCTAIGPDEWSESPVQAPLSDLSPLKGLPLQEVCVSHTRVKDLAPLAGMPLTKLNLAGTRVTDLSVLKGMPLRELRLSRLAIRDVKPLAGLPLESINISYTDVSDLAPLSGMKLKRLIATASRIRDITVLAGMPLKELNISCTEVTDLNPLIGMKLETMNLSQTRVRDLNILAALPLRWLDLSKTDVRDLSPLRGLALEMLHVNATRVKDLNPLRGMPLKWLNISNTDVRDLSPLSGLPLKSLSLYKTAVRDLAPIQNSPIEEIWLDYNTDQQMSSDTYRAYTTVLIRMPRLQKVNGNSNFRERRRHE